MKVGVRKLSKMAAILSCPTRLELLERLLNAPAVVGELVKALHMNQASISKQLSILKDAGLITCKPEGRCREYSLAFPEETSAILSNLTALTSKAIPRAKRCKEKKG